MKIPTQILKIIDRLVGGSFAWILGWWNFWHTDGPPFVEISHANIHHVLFIRPGGIGDLVMLLPVVARLKRVFPSIKISLLGEKRNKAIASMTSLFDEVLLYDEKPISLFFRLQRMNADIVIDTEQFHYSSAVFAFMSKAPVRIGFKTSPIRNELYTHLIDYSMSAHESDAFNLLVDPICGSAQKDLSWEGLLEAEKLSIDYPELDVNQKKIICVFPYFASKAKTWPAGRWAEILRRLLARDIEKIVLIGGKDSGPASEGILHALNDDRVTSLVGKLSLSQTAAILNRCNLYIGCDTGVSHLATALGKKTVVLFGSSDERKWGPPTHKGSAVSCWVPCRPCSIFGYEKKCHTIDCMDRISVDAVWKEVERYLV